MRVSQPVRLSLSLVRPVKSASPYAAVKEANARLLPPLQLYRRIWRAHRHLSADMRAIGDAYIRDEFKRHKDIDNPLQIIGFLSSWKMYLDQLEIEQGQPGGFRGKRLEPQLLEKMSDEQIQQLYDLMQATQEAYNPERAQAQPPEVRAMAEAAAREQGMSLKK